MFGDIITDLGAVLQGGMGLAASGEPQPDPDGFPSMFEPVHGSAPDIAGKGIANPIAAVLSLGMMLDHLGAPKGAEAVRRAVASVLAKRDTRTRTPDLGGTASTTAEVGRAVLARPWRTTPPTETPARPNFPGLAAKLSRVEPYRRRRPRTDRPIACVPTSIRPRPSGEPAHEPCRLPCPGLQRPGPQ